jgi:hypothetical protein
MRTRTLLVLLSCGALLGACGHGTNLESCVAAACEATARTFQDAYRAVASGAQTTARYGEWAFDRTESGAVRAYRLTERKVGEATGVVSNTYLQQKVKAKLSFDRGLHSGDIEVNADAGVVTLRGTVRNEGEASRAVEDAVRTGGVLAVRSELGWPTAQVGERSTEKPPM